MGRSTPVCQLKCSRCQSKATFAQRFGSEPRSHFNVRVISRLGEAAKCECLTCGYVYVSRSRAAMRRLGHLEKQATRPAKEGEDE